VEKIEKDGKIGVLISAGFGAGWSTWADDDIQELLTMDSEIVQAVIDEDIDKAVEIAERKCGCIFIPAAPMAFMLYGSRKESGS